MPGHDVWCRYICILYPRIRLRYDIPVTSLWGRVRQGLPGSNSAHGDIKWGCRVPTRHTIDYGLLPNLPNGYERSQPRPKEPADIMGIGIIRDGDFGNTTPAETIPVCIMT